MLQLRRRHLKSCSHRSGSYLKCKCPLWAVGTLKGSFVRRSLDTRNLERANELIREMEMGKTPGIRLKDAGDRFLADLRSRGLSPETIKKFELLKTDLSSFFSDPDVASLSADDLAKFREGWKGRPSTARKKLERLRSFFKFCIDRVWFRKNPAAGLKYPKEISIEKKPYEKEELELISRAIPLFPAKRIYGEENKARIDAFVKVLRWTGLRIRDVVQLKRSQVAKGHIILRTHKNQKPVKLVLHPDAVKALEEIKNGGEYYFWSGLGKQKSCVGDWQRTLRRLGEIAGVHIHAHRWRHTFATDLLSKGVPVSEVAAILGNSARIVEKHYSQWIESRQTAMNEAVKRVWV